MVGVQWSGLGGVWYQGGGDTEGQAEDEDIQGTFECVKEEHIKSFIELQMKGAKDEIIIIQMILIIDVDINEINKFIFYKMNKLVTIY